MFCHKEFNWSWILLFILVGLSTFTTLADRVEAGYPDDAYLIELGDNWHPIRAQAEANLLKSCSRFQGIAEYLPIDYGKSYRLYLGARFQFGKSTLEPTLGWSFYHKEWIFAVRLYPKGNRNYIFYARGGTGTRAQGFHP